MFDFLKNNVFGILAVVLVLFVIVSGQTAVAPDLFDATDVTTYTNQQVFEESVTTGGDACTLTDANGGAYTLTDSELSRCSYLTMAAGGAGQAVVALTLPATSTMKLTIPRVGMCKKIIYSAINLAAATTTTVTAGTGHNILAYTTADDVIDGLERAQLTLCRNAVGDVDTFTTEILNAD